MQEFQHCCHGAARAPTHVWDPLNSKAAHCWQSFGIIGAYLVFCFFGLGVRLGPHALIVTTRGNGNYIRVLIYASYTTISGWGPNLN